MKIIKNLFLGAFAMASIVANAQTEKAEQRTYQLPKIDMTEGVNIHFISPEPIQYVDLSTENLVGDLPAENIARIKIADQSQNDSILVSSAGRLPFTDGKKLGIITVVGQSFMAQYQAVYNVENLAFGNKAQSNIQIQPEDMQPLEFPKMKFSDYELKNFSKNIIAKNSKKPIRKVNDLKMTIALNNVYVMSDYIFLDITFKNHTNLSYDVEDIKYSIEDKKIYKATNNQSIDLEPIFKLHQDRTFRKEFRNIYVFKKFTFPNSKVLKIRLLEEQISGRTIEMIVKYSDVLNADTF